VDSQSKFYDGAKFLNDSFPTRLLLAMSVAERLELTEQRLSIAEKERDMWKARAEQLDSKLKKRAAADAAEPAAKKTGGAAATATTVVVKRCSVCSKPKNECKDAACLAQIAAKKAAKAK
jgi:hypothetical protein